MRDRLIEILLDGVTFTDEYKFPARKQAEYVADRLLANGVIVPPCKVGDTLWIVGEYRGVYSAKVRVFFFNEKGVEYIRTTSCDIPSDALGKTVFLTREAAEATLAEREGADDDHG